MDNREKKFVSAVIYVRDCDIRIETFLKNIICVLAENFTSSEIICVNDCSRDTSVEKIKRLGAAAENAGISVTIVNMSCFHGLELSMNAGRDLAIGDYVFEFDNTYPDWTPNDVMTVYNRAMQGYDIVSAAPKKGQSFASTVFYCIFQHYSPMSYNMHTESFRVLSRRAINRISGINSAVPYRKAIYASCGLHSDSVWYSPTISNAKLKMLDNWGGWKIPQKLGC